MRCKKRRNGLEEALALSVRGSEVSAIRSENKVER
jgi:hypothetical protein